LARATALAMSKRSLSVAARECHQIQSLIDFERRKFGLSAQSEVPAAPSVRNSGRTAVATAHNWPHRIMTVTGLDPSELRPQPIGNSGGDFCGSLVRNWEH
jgi:hypothetical protein